MKYILLIGIWFVLLSNVLWAKTYVISYEIYGDSKQSDIFTVKKELLDQYDLLVERVDQVYSHVLLEENIDQFDIHHAVINYKDELVTVIVGDGLGTYIHGELVQEDCMMKPRTESWLAGLFE